MGIFDGLPVPREKTYLREKLSKIDECWVAARFDSLPHVVHILTSKDREGDAQLLKEQSDVIEEVVDEVVHAYHNGFNKAIQNYSQILRLFSESAESIAVLKVDLAEAKKFIGARNKQLHQLRYRSVTLGHIISLLDQIEGISKVPTQIEKLIVEKQIYAAVQLHVHSSVLLEREGLQMVGALQDVRSELSKLRTSLFYKVLEDLHAHLYNKGEYSPAASGLDDRNDEVPTTTAIAFSINNSQPLSRRTRLVKVDGPATYGIGRTSVDGNHDELGTQTLLDEVSTDGNAISSRADEIPIWLSESTPDEFIEVIKKSDAPLHVKYLQTMVECLCLLGKVAAAGAIICQRLRPTIHDIITAKIKAQVEAINSSRTGVAHASHVDVIGLQYIKRRIESCQLPKHKHQNGISLAGTLLSVSPVSPVMAPSGIAQAAAKDLLDSILNTIVRIFENHVVVGEMVESTSSQRMDFNTPKSSLESVNWNPDSETSQITGGYSIGFSLTVLQSECQQLICEILRATPDAASADAAVQTARLASKSPSKEKRDGSEDGLTFAFRFTDATISIPNQGIDLIRQGWRRGLNVLQEGYGSAAVLPEQGIYLASATYRPVLQFTDKVASMLPEKYCQLCNDGLLAFVENFVKDHFLPTMFVDYRKAVQQAISSPAAFRPRAHSADTYTQFIEKGRPVLHGLLAIDFLAKEVLGWAHAMPKFAGDLVKYVQTFLERTFERCRTLYMEAVLEKQSYMLIGRHDIEKLMEQDKMCVSLPDSLDHSNLEYNVIDADSEAELGDLLMGLQSIKQENLIRDDNKLILLASLSDSLEYVADSIDRLRKSSSRSNQVEGASEQGSNHTRTGSEASKDLASFADEYRKLAIDCLKVLRVEMQLETLFHMQEMISREYLEDQDAEEPDDFIMSLTAQIIHKDEEMAPFIPGVKREYIFGGICGIAANASIKALPELKSINLFGVQQICRNSIALEQALAAIPSIDSEGVRQRLDRVRTYYGLLNMPFEPLLAFITEHEDSFSSTEYYNLLRVHVPTREIPGDAEERLCEILSH